MNKTTSDSRCQHNRAICVPFCSQDYNEIVHTSDRFRESLDARIEQFSELFPAEIESGYQMKDSRESKKLSIPIRRISVEKPKKKVMEEIHEEIKDENFNNKPLVCVMDEALHLWNLFKDVFKHIENKVLILDIIHILEYIWIIAHIKYKEGSDGGKKYVYKTLGALPLTL